MKIGLVLLVFDVVLILLYPVVYLVAQFRRHWPGTGRSHQR
ncbi:MAG: hypothetical protein ACK4VW_02650 [Anaerolineales bacterium]